MLTATKTYMMKNPELATIAHSDITEQWLKEHGVERLGEITRLFFDYDRKFDNEHEAIVHHKEIRDKLLSYRHYRHPIVMTESVQPKKVSFHVIFTKDYIVRDGFHPDDEKELFASIVGEENLPYIDDSVYHKKLWFRLPYGILSGKPYPHIPLVCHGDSIVLSNYALTATHVETIDYTFTPSRIMRQIKQQLLIEGSIIEEHDEEDATKIEQALHAISKARFVDRKPWYCLATIMKRYSTVQLFCQFSKDSGYEKYNEKNCKKTFETAPPCRNLGMLFKWLKEDNIDSSPYFLTIEERFMKALHYAGALTPVDCAKILHKLHPEFLYCNTTQGFFQYKEHRWINIDKGHELRHCILDLEKFMINAIIRIRGELTEAENALRDAEEEDEKDDIKNCKSKAKHLEKQRLTLLKEKNKLLDTTFRDKIIKECIPLYLNREFNDKKDSYIHFIGFTNGVMDLSENVFRHGRYNDYITLTTGYDFDAQADITRVNTFLSQIFPDPVLRDFHIKFKAHCLYGSNPLKTILFETNKEGNNGKTTLTTLDMLTFGEYAYTMNSAFLSYVDKGGSGAKADIMGIRGKRLVFINEPNQKLGMNISALKEFRGNDKITARGLFEKNPSSFKNQSKMIVICNKLPTIESDDGAFFDSIKILDFEAKFSDHAPDTEEEQRKACHFMINRTLTFDVAFQQGYMRLLWETYLENGIDICFPYQVEGASRAFQAKSDPILSFIRERTKESDSTLTYTDLYNAYSTTHKIKKEDFFEQVKTYKMYSHAVNGINGLCFRDEGDDDTYEACKTQKIDTEFEDLIKDKVFKKTDKTFKRIQDIIKDWSIPKSKSASVKLKEFFMRRDVTIIIDKSNGHKIFIDY